jgi:hypothetical protein
MMDGPITEVDGIGAPFRDAPADGKSRSVGFLSEFIAAGRNTIAKSGK